MYEQTKQRKGSDPFGQETGQLCRTFRTSLCAYQLGCAPVIKRLATTTIFNSISHLANYWLANQEKQRLAVIR